MQTSVQIFVFVIIHTIRQASCFWDQVQAVRQRNATFGHSAQSTITPASH